MNWDKVTQIHWFGKKNHVFSGNPERRLRYYDPKNNEYFFDRSASSFVAILYYFQSGGELYRPLNINFKSFELDLHFFGISEFVIAQYREDEGVIAEDEKPMPKNLLRRKIWLLVEYPESSKQAKIVSIISILVIIISITIFCMETLPTFANLTEEVNVNINDPFFLIETVCNLWFILEILIRLLSSPSKIVFITNTMNLIDIVAVAPYFINLITILAEAKGGNEYYPCSPSTKFSTILSQSNFYVNSW